MNYVRCLSNVTLPRMRWDHVWSRLVEQKCFALPASKKKRRVGCVAQAKVGLLQNIRCSPDLLRARVSREAVKGKQSGRTQEIQRLIGRSLRAVVDMIQLAERQIILDCDVLQADGGTRTASICGAYVALHDACTKMMKNGIISTLPLLSECAAISVGIVGDTPMLDLAYTEDSSAEVDMNVVMNGRMEIIEVQGTAEGQTFSRERLNELLNLAEGGLAQIFEAQRAALS